MIIVCSERMHKKISSKKNCVFLDPVSVKKDIRSLIKQLIYQNIKTVIIIDECIVLDKSVKDDIFIVTDHINMTGDNPLIGKNDDSVGPRFPDMTDAYSPELRETLKRLLSDNSIDYRKSILACSEKPIEDHEVLSKLKSLNCHISNFSIPWVSIAANHAGMRVAGLALRKDADIDLSFIDRL